MIIIMLGAPGTGKGTVGSMLSKNLGIVHISSGEIFRSYIRKSHIKDSKEDFLVTESECKENDVIRKHDNLGNKIEEYVKSGNLVPDELTVKIVEKRLNEPDAVNGFILDGYPRTKTQAIELDRLLKYINKEVAVAVNLSLPDNQLIERTINRRTCPNPSCREIYNLQYKKPKVDGICDMCGNTLIQRDDDNEETVKQRLKVYHEASIDLIKYYKEKDILYTLKLNEESENTTKDIAEEINHYLEKRVHCDYNKV